jgi:formate--tetrahydrofolate ligase
LKHVENITKKYGIPAVVAINQFPTDTEKELALVQEECNRLGVNAVLSEVWAKGGEGGLELAKEVVRIIEEGGNNFKPIYDLDMGHCR